MALCGRSVSLIPRTTPDGVTLWEHQGTGAIYSIDPPDAWFGFSCHSMMMPPQKPKNMLIIGVAKNTLGRLCKEKWPDLEITLCDVQSYDDPNIIISDGLSFLKQCESGKFDFVALDAYEGNIPAPFMSESETMHELHRVASHVVVNYVDTCAEMVTTWFRTNKWRLQQYRRVAGNNVWFFSRINLKEPHL